MGNSEGGVGLLGLVFVLFLGLKLGGVIDWSWWWVTAPLWGPIAIGLLVIGGFAFYWFVIDKDYREYRRSYRTVAWPVWKLGRKKKRDDEWR